MLSSEFKFASYFSSSERGGICECIKQVIDHNSEFIKLERIVISSPISATFSEHKINSGCAALESFGVSQSLALETRPAESNLSAIASHRSMHALGFLKKSSPDKSY